MKYLIVLSLFLSAINVYAEQNACIPQPVKHVVKRKKKVAPKPIVCPAPEVKEKVVETKVFVSQKNHLRLLGGFGPTGVGLDRNGDSATLTRNNKAVFGLGYGRNVSERWSIEGVGLTNGTALIGAGYNW